MTGRLNMTAAVTVLVAASSQPVLADWLPKYSIRALYDSASDSQLGTGTRKNDDAILAADFHYGGRWLNDNGLSLDVMSRFYLASGEITTASDSSESSSSQSYAEIKHLNLKKTYNKNYGQWWASVGRTRVREATGLLWDRDIEGIALGFDSTLLKSEIRLSEQFWAWRTDKSDFKEDDKKRTYISGYLDWQWYYQHHLRLLVLSENDNSGSPETGSVYDPDDPDKEDRRALWGGIELVHPAQNRWSYRLAAMAVTGEDRRLRYETEGSSRKLTGEKKYDLSGWLVDTSVQWQVPMGDELGIEPVIGIGYTLTSKGTVDDGKDRGFVQPGLASNRYRLNPSGLAMHRTGEAYRAELSNMSVLSARFGMKSGDWQGAVQWNDLNRRNDKAGIGNSNISADLIPGKSHLGQSVDLQLVWTPTTGALWGGLDKVTYRLRGGWFRAGDAYGDAKGKTRTRVILDIILRHSSL